MATECMTIRYLREHYMSEGDKMILHMLVDEIRKSGHDILLDHLRHDAPDCEICAALAARAAV